MKSHIVINLQFIFRFRLSHILIVVKIIITLVTKNSGWYLVTNFLDKMKSEKLYNLIYRYNNKKSHRFFRIYLMQQKSDDK